MVPKQQLSVSAPYPIYCKYLKIYFITKLHRTLKKYFTLVFERILIHRRVQYQQQENSGNLQIKRVEYAPLLMDLSKTFHCLPHDLITTKLQVYAFKMLSVRLMHSYLTHRYQRVKTNNSYSLWSLINYGMHQGLILGPVLFNVFLTDMFY